MRFATVSARTSAEPLFCQSVLKTDLRSGKMLSLILLIVLVLLLIGALPSWPYSRSWGYAPSGLLTLVVVIVVILAVTGRL
jgi:hypothetical protein